MKDFACAVIAGFVLGWLIAVKLRFGERPNDSEDDAYIGIG